MILYDFANWTYDAVVEAIAMEYSQKNIKRKVVTFDKKFLEMIPVLVEVV